MSVRKVISFTVFYRIDFFHFSGDNFFPLCRVCCNYCSDLQQLHHCLSLSARVILVAWRKVPSSLPCFVREVLQAAPDCKNETFLVIQTKQFNFIFSQVVTLLCYFPCFCYCKFCDIIAGSYAK